MDGMGQAEPDSVGAELRDRIEQLREAYDRQQEKVGEIQARLAELRIRAESSDGLVSVTVDAAGIVTAADVTAKAMRSTPARVQSAFVEAAQAAARTAQEHSAAMIAPLEDEVNDLPDLSELVPGMPDLHEMRATLLGDHHPGSRT